MQSTHRIELFIEKEKEGLYFDQPFQVPENVYRIDLNYHYPNIEEKKHDNGSVSSEEINIIDLSIFGNDGCYLGSSGADRAHIFISEYHSSIGYAEVEILRGKWTIYVGAYKIQPQGVTVTYEITYHYKETMLLKGDLHTHTVGSDGNLTMDELTVRAVRNGLDFLFITDHNNYAHNYAIRTMPDLTVVPGMEWTHFKGHIGMHGVKKVCEGTFGVNEAEEVKKVTLEAERNGALVVVNHPFDEGTCFQFGIDNVFYHCIEIWNGPFKASDEKCRVWWHEKLCMGKQINIVGGSDYHREEFGRDVGMPATCVYSCSPAPSDICKALKAGNCYISYAPQGPGVMMTCNGACMGEEAVAEEGDIVKIHFSNLTSGDVLHVLTDTVCDKIEVMPNTKEFIIEKTLGTAEFVRVEVYRKYLAGSSETLAMISNPIYIRGLA